MSAPSISVPFPHHASAPNELGMRPMQERAYQKRGEQHLQKVSRTKMGAQNAVKV